MPMMQTDADMAMRMDPHLWQKLLERFHKDPEEFA